MLWMYPSASWIFVGWVHGLFMKERGHVWKSPLPRGRCEQEPFRVQSGLRRRLPTSETCMNRERVILYRHKSLSHSLLKKLFFLSLSLLSLLKILFFLLCPMSLARNWHSVNSFPFSLSPNEQQVYHVSLYFWQMPWFLIPKVLLFNITIFFLCHFPRPITILFPFSCFLFLFYNSWIFLFLKRLIN